jgi:DNA-binding CsgD family transcriptional regulator
VTLARDLLARVDRTCTEALPAKALRERLVELVRRVIPFDAYNFPLTDPVTRVGTSPLADVPMLPWSRLPALISWRYLTPAYRWDRLLDTGSGAQSLLAGTDGHPERSQLWQHAQRELGITDTATVAFGDRYGCWGALDIWRAGGAPFAPGDLQLLSGLVGSVTAGLRRAVARTFVDPDHQLLPLGPAVVVLSADLEVRSRTAAAAEALLRLNPPDEPIAPIPAAAYNVAAALLADEQGMPIGAPWSRVHLGGSRWVTVKASRLGSDIAVSIEPSTTDERMDMYARASGLSERESQVLALLGAGLETREIAARLVVSEHTAADHVKAILAKTGARTRQLLLARGLGAR